MRTQPTSIRSTEAVHRAARPLGHRRLPATWGRAIDEVENVMNCPTKGAIKIANEAIEIERARRRARSATRRIFSRNDNPGRPVGRSEGWERANRPIHPRGRLRMGTTVSNEGSAGKSSKCDKRACPPGEVRRDPDPIDRLMLTAHITFSKEKLGQMGGYFGECGMPGRFPAERRGCSLFELLAPECRNCIPTLSVAFSRRLRAASRSPASTVTTSTAPARATRSTARTTVR
jgi:hypothetical protein